MSIISIHYVHILYRKKNKKNIAPKTPHLPPASLEIKPWPRDKSTLSLRRCFKPRRVAAFLWRAKIGWIFHTKWFQQNKMDFHFSWVIQASWYFASRFRGEIYEVRSKSRRFPLLSWPWFLWEITAMSYHLPWAYLGNLFSSGPGEIPGCVGPECPTKVHRKGDVACNFWKILRWSKVRPNLKIQNKHI